MFRYYKIFFVALLVAGGFLLLASGGSVLAEDNTCYVCCCNNGLTVPGSDCAASCLSSGGVQSWSMPYYCNESIPGTPICESTINTDRSEGEIEADTNASSGDDYSSILNGLNEDACGGICDSSLGLYCNETTGSCEYDPTNAGLDNSSESDYDPTSSNSSNSSKKSSSGGGNASLPNFVGVESISELILKITDFLIKLAIPFAVLMLVWAGFKFAAAQGSEEKLREAKRNLAWTVAGIAVIMASNAIVGYVTDLLGGNTEGNALITIIEDALQQIISVLFILVTVYFFWGIVEFVRGTSSGDTNKLEDGKRHMIWGIVGMAVMAGAWGIVEAIQQVFQ